MNDFYYFQINKNLNTEWILLIFNHNFLKLIISINQAKLLRKQSGNNCSTSAPKPSKLFLMLPASRRLIH